MSRVGPTDLSRRMFQRVDIQHENETDDDSGQPVPDWQTLDTVWCRVHEAGGKDAGGREFWRAQQIEARLTHLVIMRYYAGLSVKHRIVHDGRTLNIERVENPDGRKVEHHALCIEVAT